MVAFWLPQSRRAFVIFAALVVVVLSWWVTIRPSQSRDWKPDVRVVPRAHVDGDKVTLSGDVDGDNVADVYAVLYVNDGWIDFAGLKGCLEL